MNFITTNNAPDRKKLVKALAEHFDFDATYAGPPTFNYNVGDITVERDGQLATEDEALAARLKDFLIQNEWLDAEATEAPAEEAPAAEAEPDLEDTVMKVGYPLDGMTVTGLTNLIHLLYSKQYLIGKSVREELIAITDETISELHFIVKAFGERLADAEEEAFLFGDGMGKPLGLVHQLEHVVDTENDGEITPDDLLELQHSIPQKYRENAVFLMHDSTIARLRHIRSARGRNIWEEDFTRNTPDRLLGIPVIACTSMPRVESGSMEVLFGDFSQYLIGDREHRSVKRLAELYVYYLTK